jgi:hypothetical protein
METILIAAVSLVVVTHADRMLALVIIVRSWIPILIVILTPLSPLNRALGSWGKGSVGKGHAMMKYLLARSLNASYGYIAREGPSTNKYTDIQLHFMVLNIASLNSARFFKSYFTKSMKNLRNVSIMLNNTRFFKSYFTKTNKYSKNILII